MADISQITLPNGDTYSFKDASARASIPDKINISEKGASNGVAELDNTGKVPSSQLNEMTGATSSANGTSGIVPAPTTTDVNSFLCGDGTWKLGGKPMVILSYGNSTWNDFINAYNDNVIVYCRASSSSNPASGNQTRMAFMAYINSNPPTEVEFQYYRSVSSHSATQQGDQVFVYKLNSAGTWTVTTREAMSKIAAGTNMSSSYNNGTITLNADSEILEYADYSLFPFTGSEGKIYVDQSTNSIYRWGGSAYASLGSGSPPASISNNDIDALFT